MSNVYKTEMCSGKGAKSSVRLCQGYLKCFLHRQHSRVWARGGGGGGVLFLSFGKKNKKE